MGCCCSNDGNNYKHSRRNSDDNIKCSVVKIKDNKITATVKNSNNLQNNKKNDDEDFYYNY